MKILVTSFGPFNGFEENPSNKVMNCLREKLYEIDFPGISICWETLEVTYAFVDQFENRILNHSFDLIIHLGVASLDPMMRLEVLARNNASGIDFEGKDPENKFIQAGKNDIQTNIDLNTLTQICNLYPEKIRISDNAGAYLCNYVYFKSLLYFGSKARVLFIHNADFQNNSKAVNLEEQTEILFELFKVLIKQEPQAI